MRRRAEHIRAAAAAVKENRWNDAEAVLIKKINPSYRIGDGAMKALTEYSDRRIKEDEANVAASLSRTTTTVTLVLIGGSLAVAACNTVRGAAEDVNSAANAVDNAT